MAEPDVDGKFSEHSEARRNLQRIARLTGNSVESFSRVDGSMAALETIAEIVQLWLKITSEVEKTEIIQRMRAAAAKSATVRNP